MANFVRRVWPEVDDLAGLDFCAVPLTLDASLSDVRAFISQVASTLDPNSRYVTELLAVVGASRDVPDLVARLTSNSRGARHAGRQVFEQMTVEQKLRCNLITNETVLFRFSEGEWEALQSFITRFQSSRPGRVLCAPCSHGEEAFSVAAACLQAGVEFRIDAFDIQPACIEAARAGRMTMGFPDAYLENPAVVSREVLSRIGFAVADLLAEPAPPVAGPWDLIVCRNFLGYFIEAVASRVAVRLANSLEAGGALFLDSFCLTKFSSLARQLEAAGLRRRGASPVFQRG
jgi:chemotaxis methyl-accepting protein methylase